MSRIVAITAIVWVILAGCRAQPDAGGAVESPALSTPSVPAAPLVDAAVSEEPERIDVREVQALLDQWIAAQNSGDFATYESVYAAPFVGVKRVGERVEEFDHEGWLTDRKRMFDKPMSVRADTVDIRVMERRATVTFVQTWSSGRYEDVGPKELIIEPGPKGLRIRREEMLRSTVGRSGKHIQPPPPTTIDKLLASARFVVASSDNVLFTPPADDVCGDEWEACNDTWFQLDTEPDGVTRKQITAADAEEYLRLLADPETYGAPPAACYMPRLVVAFYHADETIPWATAGVCIECATIGLSPAVGEIHGAMPEFDSGFHGVSKLKAWCERLGLGECADDVPHYEVE